MDTVTVAVERQTQVFVDQRFGGVAVVVRDDRQWPQSLGLETFERALTRLAMYPLIGDFCQPLPRLPVHVMQIGKLAQRPEILAKISDSALDFPFFPAAGGIAGMRVEAIFTGEGEETWKETDETAIVFGSPR